MLVDNLFGRHAICDHAEHGDHRESQTSDAGLAVHLLRLDGDPGMDRIGHGLLAPHQAAHPTSMGFVVMIGSALDDAERMLRRLSLQ